MNPKWGADGISLIPSSGPKDLKKTFWTLLTSNLFLKLLFFPSTDLRLPWLYKNSIPIWLRRTLNLSRRLDLLQFRSMTYEVKGYKKKENLLKGIKNWYSQMLGHSDHKVRSMSTANGCSPGHSRGGKHFILQLCEHRGGRTIYVRSRRKATNLSNMKE